MTDIDSHIQQLKRLQSQSSSALNNRDLLSWNSTKKSPRKPHDKKEKTHKNDKYQKTKHKEAKYDTHKNSRFEYAPSRAVKQREKQKERERNRKKERETEREREREVQTPVPLPLPLAPKKSPGPPLSFTDCSPSSAAKGAGATCVCIGVCDLFSHLSLLLSSLITHLYYYLHSSQIAITIITHHTFLSCQSSCCAFELCVDLCVCVLFYITAKALLT